MKRFLPFLILVFLLSCKKSESDFIWERTFGKGEAYLVKTTADSGFIACGRSEGKPYLVSLDKNRSIISEITGQNAGLYSSAWTDTSGYIISGSSHEKMLIDRFDSSGDLLWEITRDAGFRVDFTNIFPTDENEFLAVGTSAVDSAGATGVFFLKFDTAGNILQERKYPETYPIWADNAVIDNSGYIYIAVTRKIGDARPRACLSKYSFDYGRIWETELFNSPSYSSSCLAVCVDASGNVFAAGKTELPSGNTSSGNSFLVALNSSGGWSGAWTGKKYPEIDNAATAILKDDSGNLLMLNRKCYIVSIFSSADGSDAGQIRSFSVCIPAETDAYGNDMDITYDGNLLLGGSKGGNFYLALKPAA